MEYFWLMLNVEWVGQWETGRQGTLARKNSFLSCRKHGECVLGQVVTLSVVYLLEVTVHSMIREHRWKVYMDSPGEVVLMGRSLVWVIYRLSSRWGS